MISLDEIDKAILDLESKDTTFATCERLAWLYTVRDHISGNSLSRSATPNYESEFLANATTCNIDVLMKVMDEHFAVIKLVCPKEYEAVISKIRSAKDTPFIDN